MPACICALLPPLSRTHPPTLQQLLSCSLSLWNNYLSILINFAWKKFLYSFHCSLHYGSLNSLSTKCWPTYSPTLCFGIPRWLVSPGFCIIDPNQYYWPLPGRSEKNRQTKHKHSYLFHLIEDCSRAGTRWSGTRISLQLHTHNYN
jgi:hypothetical protein